MKRLNFKIQRKLVPNILTIARKKKIYKNFKNELCDKKFQFLNYIKKN